MKKTRSALAGPVFLTLLLLAGCATPVKTDYKAGADFNQYRTFAVMPLPQRAPAEDPGAVLRLAQPAKDAVVESLTAKGLTEAPADHADLTVNLRGQSLPKVQVRDYGYTYPVMTRYGMVTVVQNPYTSVSTITERKLIIELLDNKAKELVWVGWLTKESSAQVTPEALREAIGKVLAEYPPGNSTSSNK
jgi:hypothetical protein